MLNEKLAGLCSQIQEIISLNNVRASNEKLTGAKLEVNPEIQLNLQSTIDATFDEGSPQMRTKPETSQQQMLHTPSHGLCGADVLVENMSSELVPQWKHECLISLEHMRQMYLRSSDLAKQLIACS